MIALRVSHGWMKLFVLDCGSGDKNGRNCQKIYRQGICRSVAGAGDIRKIEPLNWPGAPGFFLSMRMKEQRRKLAREIGEAIRGGGAKAYAMRRKNFYKDQWINHCGWWPDWVKRVFPKRRGTIQRGRDSRFTADFRVQWVN